MEQQNQKDCDKTINEGLSRFLGPPIKQPTLSTSDNDIDGHFDSLTSRLQRLSKTPLIFHEPMMKAVELLTERFAQYQKWHSLRETGTNGSDCGLEDFANLTKIMLSFAVIHLLDFRKTKDLDADDNEQLDQRKSGPLRWQTSRHTRQETKFFKGSGCNCLKIP